MNPDETAILDIGSLNIADASSDVQHLADQLRIDSIRASTSAGSGHPTSAMSCADIMAALMARHFKYDWQQPKLATNDRMILSKGHVSSLWYAILKAAGVIDDDELMTYRQARSPFAGHPTPAIPWVEIATGSLGQGLCAGVGMAYAGAKLRHEPFHTWVLCGDGELAEGSMWEAFEKAAVYGLGNLTAIIDGNAFGQSGALPYSDGPHLHADRIRAFGWNVLLIDGHNIAQVDAALKTAAEATDQPVAIVARTVKGKGLPSIEARPDRHGTALSTDEANEAIRLLKPPRPMMFKSPLPAPPTGVSLTTASSSVQPTYEVDDKVAIRSAFADAITAVGESEDVVLIDGDVNKATYTDRFRARFPDRFVQTWIAEQQMVGTAVGLSSRGFRPIVSGYAAFLSRAFDFMRMAAVSRTKMLIAGSHGGIEIGRDGASQMALEDLATMRSITGSTVLFPSDATSMWRLTEAALDRAGITYLRVSRGEYPVLYSSTEKFEIGGSKTVRSTPNDTVLVLSAGATLQESVVAADKLAAQGVHVRVIDMYSVKPIDAEAVRRNLAEVGGKLFVVEDHRYEGGIGAAVLESFNGQSVSMTFKHLAVDFVPGSASPQEQYEMAGLSADHLATAFQEFASSDSD